MVSPARAWRELASVWGMRNKDAPTLTLPHEYMGEGITNIHHPMFYWRAGVGKIVSPARAERVGKRAGDAE